MNVRYVAKVHANVWGYPQSWRLSPGARTQQVPSACEVVIEISGNPKTGYQYVVAPVGFFAADAWYETLEQAMDCGEEMFGICRSAFCRIDRRDTIF